MPLINKEFLCYLENATLLFSNDEFDSLMTLHELNSLDYGLIQIIQMREINSDQPKYVAIFSQETFNSKL